MKSSSKSNSSSRSRSCSGSFMLRISAHTQCGSLQKSSLRKLLLCKDLRSPERDVLGAKSSGKAFTAIGEKKKRLSYCSAMVSRLLRI